MLRSMQQWARTDCGYASVLDVQTKELQDLMPSFFLSETCKYLYLLFDTDNPVLALESTCAGWLGQWLLASVVRLRLGRPAGCRQLVGFVGERRVGPRAPDSFSELTPAASH